MSRVGLYVATFQTAPSQKEGPGASQGLSKHGGWPQVWSLTMLTQPGSILTVERGQKGEQGFLSPAA